MAFKGEHQHVILPKMSKNFMKFFFAVPHNVVSRWLDPVRSPSVTNSQTFSYGHYNYNQYKTLLEGIVQTQYRTQDFPDEGRQPQRGAPNYYAAKIV